jgi:phage baseplate assembly protein W
VANIVLRNLKSTKQVENTVSKGYLYKDVDFDLNINYTTSGEAQKTLEQKDLKPLYNKNAVLTSLKNIFTTTPGEKLLNPTFGVDLRDFLFEPVSETRAFIIGNKIYDAITVQEPRVVIDDLSITGHTDSQEYDIEIKLSIPTLNERGLSLVGVLNIDGFTISNVN